MSQKEFFDRSIADMEQDLQQAIEAADTTEKDARFVIVIIICAGDDLTF